MAEARAPHVALLSSPGMGHLFPIAEFTKRLVLDHGFTATIITYTDFNSTSQLHSFFTTLPPSISSLSLPSVPLADLPPDTRMEARLCVLAARSAPSVKGLLLSLRSSSNLVAYVTDIFGADTFLDARELGVPTYMFFTSNYFMLSFMFHLPTLDATTSCEFRDLPEPLELPGCVPLRGVDFLDPLEHRTNAAYPWIVHMARLFRDCDGILVNSFLAMEPDAARALSEEEAGRPPVLPVGPIVRSGSGGSAGSTECVTWLDEQPHGSVLFVSFGSGGSITCEQTRELALGLESSGQRFLWVIRTPSDSEANAAFFGIETSAADPLDCLPEGFLSRTRPLGLVVRNWAPQMEVLAHGAVGGFLSHCGWNSTLESVVHGVPMIAWPLYAEQRMNAVMLVEGAKVALRPSAAGEKGLVGREEICKVVKELMEGEGGKAVRDRVLDLKKAATEAICEGGTSYGALAGVVKKWKYNIEA
uniref:Glycosyltransferase n=1 Tax=Iris domestica TaxID=58944 RepID=A0AA96Q4D5_IRIDM|nr:glycosyltransferase [Iris domestica]